ncbi:MAG: class I SAM-dependent methyltransferase [Anaerolineales bacterium]|nr:class I SAM-dependent methyltransferase [Anaerolineales bacterium]
MAGLEHFDLLAPLYDRLIHPPDTDAIVGLLGPDPSAVLLDAGGGTGRIAKQISDLFHSVVITDASAPMLRQAKGNDRIALFSCLTENLPFAGGAFSKIIMVDALHHIFNHRQTLTELWRVLAPGGSMVIEEPDIRLFGVKLLALAEKLALFRSHFLSPIRIAAILTELGAQPTIHPDPPNVRVLVRKPR